MVFRSGYYQFRLDDECIPMKALRTINGHFEFKFLPYGLTNAPACFMSLMNETFKSETDHFLHDYFDDILVQCKSLEEYY